MLETHYNRELAQMNNKMIKTQMEIASNPNWEEENEYRKGKL